MTLTTDDKVWLKKAITEGIFTSVKECMMSLDAQRKTRQIFAKMSDEDKITTLHDELQKLAKKKGVVLPQ